MLRVPAALFLAAGLLAGCANPWNSMNFAPGTPREQVIARAGPPARVWPLPNGGQRLQYTLMPTGYYAFMADFDATGRLLQVRQVMAPSEFLRIQDNAWTREDVEREFGPPARIDSVTSWNGPISTYRWYEPGQGPMFWFVYFDPQGVVRRSHPGIEFFNSPNDRG
jgi:hypothetical protein